MIPDRRRCRYVKITTSFFESRAVARAIQNADACGEPEAIDRVGRRSAEDQSPDPFRESIGENLGSHASEGVAEDVELVVAERVKDADRLECKVGHFDGPAYSVGFPVVPMVGNDHSMAFGKGRDQLVVGHLPVESPTVDQDEWRGRLGSRFADKELLLTDENRATRNGEGTFLFAFIRWFDLGAEQAPQQPSESDRPEESPSKSHGRSVEV